MLLVLASLAGLLTSTAGARLGQACSSHADCAEVSLHCYFLSGIDNGSGHLALGLVSQSIFNVDNSMLDCSNVVMFCCWPKPSSKDMSPVQAGPLSINFPGS